MSIILRISKAGYLFLKFSDKGKSAYVTGNEGSDVALVRHDPDLYVDIQDTAPPQYILGISEDKTAPGIPVVAKLERYRCRWPKVTGSTVQIE